MPRIVPLPPAARGRAFRITELAEFGISERRSSARDLQRPFRGVRSHGLDLTALSDRCAAYRARMTPDQFFSHSTAAMLHGIPVPLTLWRETRLHVSVLRPAYPPDTVGVIGHRLRAPLVRDTVAGLPVADPVTTWCLLGSIVSIRDLIAAADYLVGPKPKATLAQLEVAAAAWHGQNGAAALRIALPAVRLRVRSPRATLLRLLLVDAGLPEPEINYWIYDDHGQFLAESDLVYPEEKVVLEYEGDHHRTDAQQWRKDIARRESLEDAGWRVVRVSADDLDLYPDRLIARIRKARSRPRPRS
jgi:hypothetical protein